MNTTCTLASILVEQSLGPVSILLVSEGYRTSVPAYTSNHDGNILKISTIHVKSRKLMEIVNTTNIGKEEKDIDGREFATAAFRVENFVTALDEITSRPLPPNIQGKDVLGYSVEDHKHQLSVEISKKQHSITFRLTSIKHPDIDIVQSSYNVKELSSQSSFSETTNEVAHLDLPEDDNYTVTFVMMSVEESTGSFLSLYKLVAGDLDVDPSRKENDWELKTVRIKNSNIHQLIKNKFHEQFLSSLTTDLKEKWIKDSQPFVVITDLTSIRPDSRNLDVITPTSHRSDNGRRFYTFAHDADKDVCFDIFEPASPPYALAKPGKRGPHGYDMKVLQFQLVLLTSFRIDYSVCFYGRLSNAIFYEVLFLIFFP